MSTRQDMTADPAMEDSCCVDILNSLLHSKRCLQPVSVTQLVRPTSKMQVWRVSSRTAEQRRHGRVVSACLPLGSQDGPISGFGRRLSSTDGLLEGFFNMISGSIILTKLLQLTSPHPVSLYLQGLKTLSGPASPSICQIRTTCLSSTMTLAT